MRRSVKMTDKARTIRDAIAVALEGLPGQKTNWAFAGKDEKVALRSYIIDWVQDYAKRRGVILDPAIDIVPELDRVIAELKR